MPEYEIIIRCRECKREHPILMKIHLSHGPKGKQSVAEFFHGRLLPPQVRTIQWHRALCLQTGKKFKLEATDEILLVPPSAMKTPKRKIQALSDA